MTETIIKPDLTEAPIIQSTDDYGQFRYIPANRAKAKYHVRELVASFAQDPTLRWYRPVLVNELMEVIDGQHQLEACEVLGLRVPYIVGKTLNVSTAQTMNGLQRPWRLKDYIDSYAISGNEPYALFQKYADQFGIAPTALMVYLTQGQRKQLHRDFRQGRFTIKASIETIEQQLGNLIDFQEIAPWYGSKAFAMAYWQMIKVLGENYDHKRFIAAYHLLIPQLRSSRNDYLRDFEAAYNHGRKGEPVRFYGKR